MGGQGGNGGGRHPCPGSGEKRDLRNRIDRLMRLLRVGQIITSEINFDVLFDLILEQTTDIMEAERCSIFLIDRSKRYLRAFVSTDLKRNEIQIEKDHGIAGWVFSNRTAAIIDHPYEDPRFCREVDKITGYLTRSILCVPMINRRDDCIGTLQVLNKKSGRFSEDDRHLLGYLASFTTIALENSLLYEELMASDAAKQKVIDHLSHELKTPLAVIAGVFRRLSGLIPAGDHPEAARAITRGERNVGRLEAMQEKVADIIHNRAAGDDAARYVELLDRLADIVEELEAEEIGVHRRLLERLREKIEAIYHVPPSAVTTLELEGFLEDRRRHAAQEAAFRDIALRARIETGLTIEMDPVVLTKVVDGILKNAVENTPDQGTVAIEAASGENEVTIAVRDTGVGIAENDRKNIFGGFFHTQKTENYATKRPYHFNAGGSGSDLLRVRAFSERFGFKLALVSRRCPHLRTDADVCPGTVSACPHVGSPAECAASGGSEFILRFPAPHA